MPEFLDFQKYCLRPPTGGRKLIRLISERRQDVGNSANDPMFSSRTDDELLRSYNGMCAISKDLGMKHVPATEFKNRQALIDDCNDLHIKINAFRAGLDAGDDTDSKPASSPASSQTTRERTPRATPGRQRAATKEDTMSNVETTETPVKKTRKAKAAPVKPAKATKAAKAIKKPAKAPKARAAAAPREARIPLDAKITIVTKENPRREGTVQHDRYEVLKKFNNKTVEQFLDGDGDRNALNYAVAGGHVVCK